MEPSIQLLLAMAAPPVRWEDEEKGVYDVEHLRQEFRRRLYGRGRTEVPVLQRDSPAGAEVKTPGLEGAQADECLLVPVGTGSVVEGDDKDQNTELLWMAGCVQKWEDEEKACYDLETLREEFHKRLHGHREQQVLTSEKQNGSSEKKE
jgi:hypothetical protein